MSDYRQRFRERFGVVRVLGVDEDILAFIDEVVAEREPLATIDLGDFARQVRIDERNALIEKVEGMKSESDSLVKDVRNDTLDTILTYLRTNEKKRHYDGGVCECEPDASQGDKRTGV